MCQGVAPSAGWSHNALVVRAAAPIQATAQVDRAGTRVAAVKGQTQQIVSSATLKQADMTLLETVGQVGEAGLTGMFAMRVNVPDSSHHLADLEAAFACDIDAVVIPKFEWPQQAFPAAHWVKRRDTEAPRSRPRMLIGGI